jgi:hypothetical protein
MNRPPFPTDGAPMPGRGTGDGWRLSSHADGLPPMPGRPDPTQYLDGGPVPEHPAPSRTAPKPGKVKVSSIMASEGPRGHATRATVWMRYFAFFAEVMILSAVSSWFTSGISTAAGAGKWMLIAATTMLVAGALGTIRHPNERNTIIKETRKYVLGFALRPGALLAGFLYATKGVFTDANNDAFSGLLQNALPIVFFATIIIPAIIHIRFVFGIGHLNRSMDDNQSLVARYTRQDGMQN